MCLLKNELQDTGCGHEECRNFYAYNKQMCMFGLSQNQPANLLMNTNSLLQSQLQPQALNTSLLSHSLHPIQVPQKALNAKRSQSPHERSNVDEEESTLNKKFKAEGFRERNANQSFHDSAMNNLSDLSKVSQQLLNGSNASNPLLTTLLNANTVNALTRNSISDSGLFPFNNNISLQSVSNAQNNLLGLNDGQNESLSQAQFDPSNPISRFLLQAKINQSNQFEKKTKPETGFCVDTFLQEFQSKMYGLFLSQSKMLEDLAEKNDILQDTLACLIKEVNFLKYFLFYKYKIYLF